MRLVIHAYDMLGTLIYSASHEALDKDGNLRLTFSSRGSVVMPPDIQNGSVGDQLAFLAECLLDAAYSRD